MFLQLCIGAALMALSVIVGGFGVLLLESAWRRWEPWLLLRPHRPKLFLVTAAISVLVLVIITIFVWFWALVFFHLNTFPTMEESVYFSLVSYTSLGYGDVLLPKEWRLLGGMAAANGMLNFGLFTALMIEALRKILLGQAQERAKAEEET